jgi:hypothetical protein
MGSYRRYLLIPTKHQSGRRITLLIYRPPDEEEKEERTITALQDNGGVIQTTPGGIARNMTTYLWDKYEAIPVKRDSIQRLLGVLQTPSSADDMDDLAKPFEAAELHEAFRAGRRKRAPGFDGLVREYYLREWNVIKADMCDIFNQMFFEHCSTQKQKHGIIICLHKVRGGLSPKNYRPITLVNTDYKGLARVVARRLWPVIEKHLKSSQYCGVPGTSIVDAVAAIRDVIAYSECERRPICELSFDFSNAFERIAHEYLFQVLGEYALPESFVTGIENMYGGATSSVEVNSQFYGFIIIGCAIWQGCSPIRWWPTRVM